VSVAIPHAGHGARGLDPAQHGEHAVQLARIARTLVPDVLVREEHDVAVRQGLTLVHFSAQPEPFLTQNTP